MRLIAFSIIILSGGLMLGLGSLAEHGRGGDSMGVGTVVLLGGAVLTFAELYLTRFFRDLRAAVSGKRPPQESADDSLGSSS